MPQAVSSTQYPSEDFLVSRDFQNTETPYRLPETGARGWSFVNQVISLGNVSDDFADFSKHYITMYPGQTSDLTHTMLRRPGEISGRTSEIYLEETSLSSIAHVDSSGKRLLDQSRREGLHSVLSAMFVNTPLVQKIKVSVQEDPSGDSKSIVIWLMLDPDSTDAQWTEINDKSHQAHDLLKGFLDPDFVFVVA